MHRRISRYCVSALRDDRGGELLEWVLIGGMIVVVCIALVAGFGTKVLGRWSSVNTSM